MLRITDKTLFLKEMLKLVPFEGWTDKAMHEAAKNSKLSPVTLLMLFPQGVVDVVDFFCEEGDRHMEEVLQAGEVTEKKVRERIAMAVKTRLTVAFPHRVAVQRSVTYLALPHHTPHAARFLWRTVDKIWHAVGDNATDHSYYTKRLMLAGIYSSTLLFWLDDKSEGQEESWQFLHRRIQNALQFGKISNVRKYIPFLRLIKR